MASKQKYWREHNRSLPGEFPHVDTGHLRRNVWWDAIRPLSRRVGTGIGGKESVGYAMWLEFGTRKMAARPWLRPSMAAARQYILKILARKFA